jgi:hypothetical protein
VTGAVQGPVRIWLRAEGVALLLAAVSWYAAAGHAWSTFALVFLAPDVSFVGYLAGPRVGAVVYNVAHALVLPLVMAALGAAGRPELLPVAAIWIAHIGFDRMLGYGLKYTTAFGDTHLGRIGRATHDGRQVDSE